MSGYLIITVFLLVQLLTSFLWVFHSSVIPQFLVPTRASLLLALLGPSLCILSHWGGGQLVLQTALPSFGFGAPLLPPYTWWVAALSHASSYLWSDFLSKWACSLLHFSRQKFLQCLTTTARQLRCPYQWPVVRRSLHTDPCANTREQWGAFILSALIVPSPERLIRLLYLCDDCSIHLSALPLAEDWQACIFYWNCLLCLYFFPCSQNQYVHIMVVCYLM